MAAAGAAYATANNSTDAAAASGNTVLIHATPHDRLFSLVFSGSNGLAVGENGLLMQTADAGKTWSRDKAPTDLALLDVATNGTRTIAVGQMGLVLVRDGTGPWKKVESGTQQRLLQVDINAHGIAFITGAFGTLLKSTDGGETWASAAPEWAKIYDSGTGDAATVRDEPTNWVVHIADDDSIIIAGEYGQINRSVDGGATWQAVFKRDSSDGTLSPTIFSMAIRKDGVGYAVGQAGFMLHTTDSGLTWQEMPAPAPSNLFGVDSFDNGEIVVVGQRVGVRSRDGGKTWAPITGLDMNLNWYAAVAHSEQAAAGEVIGVGHSGRVIRLVP